jgi:hypothetical protein
MSSYKKGIKNIIIASLFASLSGVFGKLSLDSNVGILDNIEVYYIRVFLKIFCFSLNIFFSGLMWSYFIEALQILSTLSATGKFFYLK